MQQTDITGIIALNNHVTTADEQTNKLNDSVNTDTHVQVLDNLDTVVKEDRDSSEYQLFVSMEESSAGPDPDPIVTINVAGNKHDTYISTLERKPNTLLGDSEKRKPYYRCDRKEYFFDRHQDSFKAILYFYQSGRIMRPKNVPIDVFLRELIFYRMGKDVIEQFWISEGHIPQRPEVLPKNFYQRQIWLVMEHTDSSNAARVVAFLSVLTIIVSIAAFCLETIPGIEQTFAVVGYGNVSGNGSGAVMLEPTVIDVFFMVECVCVSWFTIEFVLRLLSCPSKLVFIQSFLNIIDFLAIAPFFINVLLFTDSSGMSFAVLRVIRLVRVFRIFKLSRHSVGLQILGKTFQASVPQLMLVLFFVMIILVLFSTAIYFAEQFTENSKFDSIPTAFWYTIVTMTTVGYGDLVPIGPFGKLIGACCALVGVLVLALPVPVIVANFKHFYRQETRLANMQVDSDDVKDIPNDISVSSF